MTQRTATKNKVHSDTYGKWIPDRDAVDFWLKFFGYPAMLSKKALESQMYRERQERDKRERACPKT